MKETARIIDYTSGQKTVEYPIEYLSNHLYEFIKRLEDKRAEFLNKIKPLISDVEDAVLVLTVLTANIPVEGKYAEIQDNLKHAAELSNKIEILYTFANNYKNLEKAGHRAYIRLTVEQAKEFGL